MRVIRAAFDEAYSVMAQMVGSIFRHGLPLTDKIAARTTLTNFVLHANDMREVSAASEYLSQVVKDKRQIVEEHKELEGQANDARRSLDRLRPVRDRDHVARRPAVLDAAVHEPRSGLQREPRVVDARAEARVAGTRGARHHGDDECGNSDEGSARAHVGGHGTGRR